MDLKGKWSKRLKIASFKQGEKHHKRRVSGPRSRDINTLSLWSLAKGVQACRHRFLFCLLVCCSFACYLLNRSRALHMLGKDATLSHSPNFWHHDFSLRRPLLYWRLIHLHYFKSLNCSGAREKPGSVVRALDDKPKKPWIWHPDLKSERGELTDMTCLLTTWAKRHTQTGAHTNKYTHI